MIINATSIMCRASPIMPPLSCDTVDSKRDGTSLGTEQTGNCPRAQSFGAPALFRTYRHACSKLPTASLSVPVAAFGRCNHATRLLQVKGRRRKNVFPGLGSYWSRHGSRNRQ